MEKLIKKLANENLIWLTIFIPILFIAILWSCMMSYLLRGNSAALPMALPIIQMVLIFWILFVTICFTLKKDL